MNNRSADRNFNHKVGGSSGNVKDQESLALTSANQILSSTRPYNSGDKTVGHYGSSKQFTQANLGQIRQNSKGKSNIYSHQQ